MINEIADDIINFIKTSSYNAFVVIGDDEIKSVINDKCVDFDVLEYTGDEPVIIKDNKLVIFTDFINFWKKNNISILGIETCG